MATIHKYATPHVVETVLSTELNSFAFAGAAVAISSAIDNGADLYKYADFEVYTHQHITNGDYHALHLLEAEDGVDYEDGVLSSGESLLPAAQLIGSVRLQGPDGWERHFLRGIKLPPTKFKVMFMNFASGDLTASGNTVKMMRYNEADG